MSNFSIRLIFFTLSVIGILCIPFLSYKLIPDTFNPSLRISFTWNNASQYTIESKVTSKIEGALLALKGIKRISSKTSSGYGQIFLEFEESSNIENERFNTSAIIRQIYPGLPKDVSYPKITYQRPNNTDVTLLSYSITSNESDLKVKEFINKILTPLLSKNEGVKSVNYEGLSKDFYKIEYDAFKMELLGVSENDIKKVLVEELNPEELGEVLNSSEKTSNKTPVSLRSSKSIEDLYEIPISKQDNKIIKLKDVASISIQKENEINFFRINGTKTIGFSIIADKSANQIRLANRVKQQVKTLKSGHKQYNFILTRDSSTRLKKELNEIVFRTLISFAFLFVITLIFYRNLSYLKTLFLSLIATLLVSAIFFKILKIDIHIYSLMSIAISLGFVIDNSIIMMDHYVKNNNRDAFIPIFAATLTTLTPLFLILFADDTVKNNLLDFSSTIIVILISSLLTSFFLIPSLLNQVLPIKSKERISKIRRVIILNNLYLRGILKIRKHKIIVTLILFFLLGVPFFLLPESIQNETLFAKAYNTTFGSTYYNDKIKPKVDVYLGGALKLFVENSSQQNFVENPKRIRVSLRIHTPFGSTFSYINEICQYFEQVIHKNRSVGIDYFQSRIYNKRNAQIDVFFNNEQELSELPFLFKGFIEKESLTMSGVNFTVFGVGRPFSTASGETIDSTIKLTGFDYKQLNDIAKSIITALEQTPRIEEIKLKSEFTWYENTHQKYVIKRLRSNQQEILPNIHKNYSEKKIGVYKIEDELIDLKLISKTALQNDNYTMLNKQIRLSDTFMYKTKYNFKYDLIDVPQSIIKKNQEYQLLIQYKFKGTHKHSELVQKEVISSFKDKLPSGFDIENGSPTFDFEQNQLIIPLLICLFLIFSICTILFESFRKSLFVILIIPISFIGVFFCLYKLDIGFNYGVYAALILLIGLLVNSSIFIISELLKYNRTNTIQKSYIKAFNNKIIPILITIFSTVVGLTPFIQIDGENNFWHTFAITVCIGLGFSILTIVFILPIYLIPNRKL